MKKIFLLAKIFLIILGLVLARKFLFPPVTGSGAPPYDAADEAPPPDGQPAWLKDWQRPAGPPKVGLQVGHWKNEELPEELLKLRTSTGSSGGGKSEWEVNLAIAQETARILKENGVEVEILPATIPPKFWADVFVAIHADGNLDSSISGYKIASPRRDTGGKSAKLASFLEDAYGGAVSLDKDPNISRGMRGYYAFAWWHYEHAVHPMAASAIIETGFLTSPADRATLVKNPQVVAKGIAAGIINFLQSENLQ